MATMICATCGCSFSSEESDALPFCSERCRLVDLNRWLNEEYGLPSEDEVEPDEDQF
jgi:endogenous inhibitor of DNA gyrase (YacG/DUF329 family)